MSEQILERQADLGPSPVPGMEPLEEDASSRKRNLVVVALAVMAGLVIGGVALFVMRPAAEEAAAETALGVAAAVAVQAAAEEQAEAAAAAEQATPTKTKVKITSRDPFAPLIPKQPAPEPAPAPAPAVDAGTEASSSSSSANSSSGATISALKVSTNGASVTLKLDGKKYSVDEGEAFAKSYRLYDIFNDNCAGFLYGDQNAVVCEGDSVTLG